MTRTWHVDVTFRDPGVTADVEGYIENILAHTPGAQVERWRRGTARYWRLVYFLEGDTLRGVLLRRLKIVQRGIDEGQLIVPEPVAVALAIREASHSVLDTMPPAARRAIRGGRPPKNPPSGV